MKESANKLKMLFNVSSVLILSCVILRTISMFTSYDSIGYFSKDVVIPYIHKSLLIVSALFMLSVFIWIKKNTLPCSLPSKNAMVNYSTLLCGLIYLSSSIMLFVRLKVGGGKMIYFVLITGLIASVYYIIDSLFKNSNLTIKVIFGIFTVLNLISLLIFENSDYNIPVNSPNKIIVAIGFAFMAVFIIQALKFEADKAQPRAYISTAYATALVCFSSSIPGIIAHYSGILNSSKYLVFYLMQFTFALFAFFRAQSYTKYVCQLANLQEIEKEIESNNNVNDEKSEEEISQKAQIVSEEESSSDENENQ